MAQDVIMKEIDLTVHSQFLLENGPPLTQFSLGPGAQRDEAFRFIHNVANNWLKN
jgi:hypothetical protein